MRYIVKTFRDEGLEAKWGKTSNGAPIISLRNPNSELAHQRNDWYVCDNNMFDSMKENGIIEGYNSFTSFGEFFSIPA